MNLLAIIIPIALQQLVISLNFTIDNIMISSLGDNFIAALGSSNKFMLIIRMAIIALSSAGASLISQYKAKRDYDGINRTFIINIITCIVVFTIFVITFFTNQQFISSSFSDSLEISELSKKYLSIVIFAGLTLSFVIPLMTVIRNLTSVVYPLIASVVGLISNFVFNYLLIYGNLGFPKLGLQGAAIATIFSEVITIILLIIVIRVKIPKLSIFESIDFKRVETFLRIALPLLTSSFLTSIALVFSHNIFGRLGSEELAAYGILSPIESIVGDIFAGIGISSIIIVGNDLGASRFEQAFKNAKKIIFYGLSLSITLGIAFLLVNSYAVSLIYNIKEETMGYLIYMLKVFGIFIVARTFNSILTNGILSSGGDNTFIMFMTIITDWVIILPSIYIGVYYFNWSIVNVYLLMNSAEIVMATLFVIRFRSKKWLKNLVGD